MSTSLCSRTQHRRLVSRHAASLVHLIGHEHRDRHYYLLHPAAFGLEAPIAHEAKDHGHSYLLLGFLVSIYTRALLLSFPFRN